MNDYLFDAEGEPDEEIARLERSLRELRFDSRALGTTRFNARRAAALSSITNRIDVPHPFRSLHQPRTVAAAAMLLVVAGVCFGWWFSRPVTQPGTSPENILLAAEPPNEDTPAAIDFSPTVPALSDAPSPAVRDAAASVIVPRSSAHRIRVAHRVREKTRHLSTKRFAAERTPQTTRTSREEVAYAVGKRLARATAAKELLLALRITGDKLHHAQRTLEARLPSPPSGD